MRTKVKDMSEQECVGTKYMPEQDLETTVRSRADIKSDRTSEDACRPGRVWLVGAGPGAPDLITKRGYDLLRQADVVVYDALILPETLQIIPESAEKIYVGKRAGAHSVPQEKIQRILIREAEQGKRVVRLKGGDPFVFGRGGEEALALAERGIPCEVVPGVTSAVAVPAAFGIPVTHRGIATSFTVITGHGQAISCRKETEKNLAQDISEAEDSENVAFANLQSEMSVNSSATVKNYQIDYEALVRTGGTLVFLMGLSAAPKICRGLMDGGMKATVPAAALSKGTTAAQRMVLSTVGCLAEDIRAAGLEAPAILVVGEVCALAAWPDMPEMNITGGTEPIFGKTDAVGESENLSDDTETIFTAPNTGKGYENLSGDAETISAEKNVGGDQESLSIDKAGISQGKEDDRGCAGTIAENVTVVVTRQQEKAGGFSEHLKAMGLQVYELPAIRIQKPEGAMRENIFCALKELCGEAKKDDTGTDWLVFTSANGVEAFFDLLTEAGLDMRRLLSGSEKKFAAVGPKTAEALKIHGILTDLVPEEYTGEALGEALWKQIEKKIIVYDSGEFEVWFFGAGRTGGGLEAVLKVHDIPLKSVPVYKTVSALSPEAAKQLVRRMATGFGQFLFTFTSTSCVKYLAEAVAEAEQLLKQEMQAEAENLQKQRMSAKAQSLHLQTDEKEGCLQTEEVAQVNHPEKKAGLMAPETLKGQIAVCIGEKTARAAREVGMQAIVSKESTEESMLETVRACCPFVIS